MTKIEKLKAFIGLTFNPEDIFSDEALQIWASEFYESKLSDALKRIASHPSCTETRKPNLGSADMQYAIGVEDGHRCCAIIAMEALCQ